MNYTPSVKKGDNFLFIGEAGSGKSVISTNFAWYLAKQFPEITVDFFDMDQTKPLFRSRDYLENHRLPNLNIHYEVQLLDTPVTAAGLQESLFHKETITIIDAGGSTTGTRMIARFSQAIIHSGCCCYFVVNPYRPWSSSKEKLDDTIAQLTFQSRLPSFRYISNPTFGPETTADEILDGHAQVLTMLDARPVEWLSVDQTMAEEIGQKTETPVFPVTVDSCLSLF